MTSPRGAAGAEPTGVIPAGPADDIPVEDTPAGDLLGQTAPVGPGRGVIDGPAAPDAAADAATATDGTDSADLTGAPVVADDDLPGALEAILLVVDAPIPADTLAAAVGRTVVEVEAIVGSLSADLAARRAGIDLRHTGEGWRFYTRDVYAPVVERFVLDGTSARLSRAALETLAVVAYRQPVTRARISAVRGVNVDGVVRTLLARGLISQDGADPETGGTLYRTTELFLERLGLAALDDLPPLGPLLPEVDEIDDE